MVKKTFIFLKKGQISFTFLDAESIKKYLKGVFK